MYRNGVSIYNGPNTINLFTDNIQLNINTVYEYSVVAISCAGISTPGVKSISIGSEYLILVWCLTCILTNRIVPSSPVVTISQPNSSCYNPLISWSTSDADIPVLTYRVYRDGTLIYNGLNDETLDNSQLDINAVYEYSVVAISCVGASTAGVKSVSIKSEYLILSLMSDLYFNKLSSSFLSCCYYLTA